mmetsp:Transcript_10932/g.17812  ORF Transcript_10932/g.17812 Transcript_10932/m.17812 type:complete len:455 (+) Transcript_10932:88-1452(+)
MRSLIALFLFALLQRLTLSFHVPTRNSNTKSVSNALQMNGVAVIGLAGGIAETVACKLMQSGTPAVAILDRRPYSPTLISTVQGKDNVVFYGETDEDIVDINTNRAFIAGIERILSDKVVIIADDDGDANLRTAISLDGKETTGETFASKIAQSLPASARAVVCAASVDAVRNGGGGGLGSALFGQRGPDAFRSFCEKNNKPFSLVQYGKLIGGVPGAEPLPFTGLPLIEPELDDSYVLNSILCSPTPEENQYAQTEVCTRDSLAEMVAQLVQRGSSGSKQAAGLSALNCLITSIDGPVPTQSDWDKVFSRLQATGDVELLRIEFKSIPKLSPFVNWICDTWFPQALIDADAATILRGARPVRATKTSPVTIRIAWEDIQPDLSVKPAGSLELTIQAGPDSAEPTAEEMAAFVPSLSVVRAASSPLPGEGQLMDRLTEAINKNAYKKKFVVALD